MRIRCLATPLCCARTPAADRQTTLVSKRARESLEIFIFAIGRAVSYFPVIHEGPHSLKVEQTLMDFQFH